ncbi:MAG: hypothetical protein QW171_04115, partial [Candidatus Bilamarchaeaceae archaeon]
MRGSLRYSENYEGNTESREKTEKRNPEKTESNFFKRVGEKLLLLAGLALAAPNCGGSHVKAEDGDIESTEEIEEADGHHDTDAIDDLIDSRENDPVEVNLDDTEADPEESDSSEPESVDVVDEEVIPPDCPSPTEPPAVPELNNMFLNVANGTFSTDGGELSADSELALSFTTDGNPLACPSGNGGFEIVCEGAERNVSGQH